MLKNISRHKNACGSFVVKMHLHVEFDPIVHFYMMQALDCIFTVMKLKASGFVTLNFNADTGNKFQVQCHGQPRLSILQQLFCPLQNICHGNIKFVTCTNYQLWAFQS